MRKKRILCSAVLICMLLNIFSVCGVLAEGDTVIDAKYEDMLKVSDSNAWVLLGKECRGNKAKFSDSVELGIIDPKNPLYSENSTEKTIDGRKFYADNYASIKIDEDFCGEEDSEYLISVVYYDYGPDPGKFHIDYISKETGESKRLSLTKSAEAQDWFIQSVYLSDVDLKGTLSEGGNIRLASGVYNLFKKVEIVNISKLKREKKPLDIVSLANTKGTAFVELRLADQNDPLVLTKNLGAECSRYDAERLLNIIRGESDKVVNEKKKEEKLTQEELIDIYLQALGKERGEKDACEYIKEIGLTNEESLLINSDIPAINYNLLNIAYETLYFEPEAGKASFAAALITAGFYGDDILNIKDERMKNTWLRVPRYCPYKIITESESGHTYYYMNIFGQDTARNYVCAQEWTTDGKIFVCGVVWGGLYRYNTETQMLTAIDPDQKENWPYCFVGTDNYVYYAKDVNGAPTIYKANLMDEIPKSELITVMPKGLSRNCPYVSNDCKYISMEPQDDGYLIRNKNEGGVIARYSVEEDKWEYGTKGWDYSLDLTHCRINPVYTNLVMFCHEMKGVKQWELYDRLWVYDFDTMTSSNLYKQGISNPLADGQKFAIQSTTHEMWSHDGEYMWLVSPFQAHLWPRFKGSIPAIVRVNKDGSHRQYFFDKSSMDQNDDHLFVSGDGKWVVIDGYGLQLLNTQTHERKLICGAVDAASTSHPYQAHPTIAKDHYIVSWSGPDETGVLGVKWFDFTEMTKEYAKGGRYKVNDNIERVSYETLDSESKETFKGKRECIMAKGGNGIYLDIDEKLIDTVDGKLLLEFDYFDNGIVPITVNYTSGAKSDNDLWRVQDANKYIKRNNTNGWVHGSVLIESGNFENATKHETDIVIKGNTADVYISNITVSVP